MKISSVLAVKGANVITIRPTQMIREALALLSQHNIGALVVVDEAGKAVGILSERDIVRHAARNENVFGLPVSQLMTAKLITGSSNDDLDSVLASMTHGHFRHLPIVDDGKLVGIVTLGDAVKARLDEYRGKIDTLETQIS